MEQFFIDMAARGGPSAVFLLAGILWLSPRITRLQQDVTELKSGKRWAETCDKTHEEVDRRLERLERFANGSLEHGD